MDSDNEDESDDDGENEKSFLDTELTDESLDEKSCDLDFDDVYCKNSPDEFPDMYSLFENANDSSTAADDSSTDEDFDSSSDSSTSDDESATNKKSKFNTSKNSSFALSGPGGVGAAAGSNKNSKSTKTQSK
jgi:hypothetical protein